MEYIKATVLIIEDGDEYLDNLSRFVPGPTYLQAHNCKAALEMLKEQHVDIIYLDMRFDRIPEKELFGDHQEVTRQQNGDPDRAWKYLQINQGLYILAALRDAGHGGMPIVLAYDFSCEMRRLEHLRKIYTGLEWVSDAVTPREIEELFIRIV
ncbi:MAG: hypothetical protein GY854_19615 [Deltaproteobacteria bacterium]|nr:hypothetical protein [Deltaproteobacteria bacterium]